MKCLRFKNLVIWEKSFRFELDSDFLIFVSKNAGMWAAGYSFPTHDLFSLLF